MRRENRGNEKNRELTSEITRRKWLSIIGFTVSILLLSIAIYLSIQEENNQRLATSNTIYSNTTVTTSSELGRSINELTSNNTNNNIVISEKKIENKIAENEVEEEKKNNDEPKETEEHNQSDVRQVSNSENRQNANNNTKEETKIEVQFIKPVEGEIIKEFAMTSLTYSNTLQEWITHRGIDIKADRDTEIKSIADGTVKSIKNDPRYGTSIIISHNDGFESVYASLNSTKDLKEGDTIKQGQVIGNIGNSAVFEVLDGPHLHFEMLKDAEYVNPEIYIK